ncbi:MAG: hypothetical protein AB1656_23725 [Candidatus Omnitrophota bacterium]
MVGYLLGWMVFLIIGECTEGALAAPGIVFVQIPASAEPAGRPYFVPSDRYVDGCRIAALLPDRSDLAILTPEFVSAKDPAVSFDGETILFAGKKSKDDSWSLWRMDRDGSNKRLLPTGLRDCVSPLYVGALFHLNDPAPADRIVFVSADHGWRNENGLGSAYSLYVCDMDGGNAQRITFNLNSDFDPEVLPNGRVAYTSWKNDGSPNTPLGRLSLLEISNDGTDQLLFYGGGEPPLFKEMARFSPSGRVYFIESNRNSWLGGGDLACVSLRRPLHTHEVLAAAGDGFYHSPCPLSGDHGEQLLYVSHRANSLDSSYAIYRFGDLLQPIASEPGWHCIDAQFLAPHARVKGRATVVDEKRTVGVFYCLNAYASDRPELRDIKPGAIKRLRVIEGLPFVEGLPGYPLCDFSEKDADDFSIPSLSLQRILGDIPIEADGSFHIQVPARTPIAFQALDENGMAFISQRSWTWVMPRESRGCTGCHEDLELSPPNRLADAVIKPAVELLLPPARRRTVDFKHDIAPIVEAKCSTASCHSSGGAPPNLDVRQLVERGGDSYSQAYIALLSAIDDRKDEYYVKPGSARESPLIWHLFGKRMETNSSEAIKYSPLPKLMPTEKPLEELERRLFVEWTDMGAAWDSRTYSQEYAKTQNEKLEGGEMW